MEPITAQGLTVLIDNLTCVLFESDHWLDSREQSKEVMLEALHFLRPDLMDGDKLAKVNKATRLAIAMTEARIAEVISDAKVACESKFLDEHEYAAIVPKIVVIVQQRFNNQESVSCPPSKN